jgi:PAS domain S-box-containing protein
MLASASLACVYYAVARIGLVLQLPGSSVSIFWPPAGVAVAALLLFGVRLWPGIPVAAFFANFLYLGSSQSAAVAALAIAAGNTLEALTAFWVLRRFAGEGNFFNRARGVFWFVGTVTAACTLASTIGITGQWVTGILPDGTFRSAWITWWTGDTAGILVLTPVILCWIREPWWRYRKTQLLELLGLATLTSVAAELSFGGWIHSEVVNSLPYRLVGVGLLWCAFRFGPRETSTIGMLSSAIAIAHTWARLGQAQGGRLVELGPFVGPTLTPTDSLIQLQIFVCAVSVMSVTLAGAMAERRRSEKELSEAEARFRTIFEQAAVGVALIETATGRYVRVNNRYCELLGFAAGEMIQTTFQSLSHPEDLPQDLDYMKKLIAGHIREFTLERRYYRRDGSIIWVNLTVSPMWRPNEKPEHHIAVIQDIVKRKEAEAALRTANSQLKQLSREMIRIRDSERRHLARELHDEVGQSLAALRINLQLLRTAGDDRERDQCRVNDSVTIIDHILEEVRDLSFSMRPPLLHEAGLAPALRSYFEEQSARTGLPIDFAGSMDGEPIPPEVSLALFRIAQEALTNAIRHSQAQRIFVTLDQHSDRIKLVIADNGSGIQARTPERVQQRPRLGLLGMEERTALLGGAFTVQSSPGGGTVISVHVPLKSVELAQETAEI